MMKVIESKGKKINNVLHRDRGVPFFIIYLLIIFYYFFFLSRVDEYA